MMHLEMRECKHNLCMKDIGARIREQRKQLGWTVMKLATLAGVNQGFLSRIENGKAAGSWETYMRVAGALGADINSLLPSSSNVADANIGARKVPVLDYVQAGQWRGVDSNPRDEEMRETILTDLEHPPSTFAMRIRGDSMEALFREGDVVVIDPTLSPHPGDFVVATDESGEATFKQFRSAGRNDTGIEVFELHPLNPLYGPMRSDRQHLAIVGVMVEHRRYRRR
jgi:SOS-response transcriptional repressor LexA